MARLYNHGHVVADFEKEGYTTYRLMSDGKWLKSKLRGWKLAKFKPGINPFDSLTKSQFTVQIKDQLKFDELLKSSVGRGGDNA